MISCVDLEQISFKVCEEFPTFFSKATRKCWFLIVTLKKLKMMSVDAFRMKWFQMIDHFIEMS